MKTAMTRAIISSRGGLFETTSCPRKIASWEGESLAITMSHGAKDCKVFKLVFDPKKIEFSSIPKEWFSVEARLGKRSNF